MVNKSSKIASLFVGGNEPNQAQLKLYSAVASDLAKAVLLASGAAVLVPSQGGTGILLGILGLLISVVLFAIASNFLKGVRDL